jgi:TPP-dependent 2-oxoacid decarboxylase
VGNLHDVSAVPSFGVPSIGRVLLDSLVAAGASHIFGVPGDYNLAFLDEIEAHPDIQWVGNANELNAAYMADGYARVNGFAVLVTTYGVGELSAFNGIAGAYAEHVPVLHIVGTPGTDTQRRGLRVHHGPGDGDHEHYLRAYREVTCAAAALIDATAAADIDRVLAAILTDKQPGYLALPSDLVRRPCVIPPPPGPAESRPPAGLEAGLVASVEPGHSEQAPAQLFAAAAGRLLRGAGDVVVLVDALARRHERGPQLDKLIRKGHFTAAVLLGGKGAIDESYERFAGLYVGALSEPAARLAVENADVVIGAGLAWDDLNSGGFTTRIDDAKLIDIQPDHASAGAMDIRGLTMAQALDELYRLVEPPAGDRTATGEQPGERDSAGAALDVRETQALLSQDVLWQRIGAFLRPGDILAADQGTALWGAARLRLPTGLEFIAQPSWSSIGYTLPAVGGAQLATSPRRRSILVIGDGAAQMTVQELGTLAREGLDPIVIVVNNSGYTVERAIAGATASYNDIPAWSWQLVPAALGTGATVSSAATVGQLDAALTSAAADCCRMRFIEVLLDRDDVPAMLGDIARALAGRAAG